MLVQFCVQVDNDKNSMSNKTAGTFGRKKTAVHISSLKQTRKKIETKLI
jgi:hypothetical protein